MGGLGVKVQHFPLTLLVVLTTLELPCERDEENNEHDKSQYLLAEVIIKH